MSIFGEPDCKVHLISGKFCEDEEDPTDLIKEITMEEANRLAQAPIETWVAIQHGCLMGSGGDYSEEEIKEEYPHALYYRKIRFSPMKTGMIEDITKEHFAETS